MKKVEIIEQKKCRLCDSTEFRSILNLGDVPITSYFPKVEENDPPSARLHMVICNDCSLIQLQHSVNQDFLFGNIYGYRTGLNSEMVLHVEGLANKLKEVSGIKAGANVLDIGSNDGTFLNKLTGNEFNLVGIDPNADDMSQYYDSEIEVISDFFSGNNFGKKFDLISSIAMFYDVEDPVGFAKDIEFNLADNGVWFFEQSYALTMFENFSFDTICHEHLMYYTVSTLNKVLDLANLKIDDIQLSSANGGSLGIFASKKSSNRVVNVDVDDFIQSESARLPNLIANFQLNVRLIKKQVVDFVIGEAACGKSFWCIGASTKGNTILSYFQLNDQVISGIADKNPLKIGRVTPGTRIPIFPKEALVEANPDYAIVLPWHFKRSISENESEYLRNGGKLIFPLPIFQVVEDQIRQD